MNGDADAQPPQEAPTERRDSDSPPATGRRRALTSRRTLTLLVSPWWAALTGLSLLLLWHCMTPTGRGFALSIALLSTTAFLWLALGWRRIWLAGWLIGLALIAPSVVRAPSGRGGDADLRVTHVFGDERASFGRYSLFNILPEADQVGLGIGLAPLGDPFIDRAQSARIRGLTRTIYREMAADPAFAEIGSVMGFAYAELRGGLFDVRHYLAMVPRKQTGKLPGVVFLHGSAGNFACLWHALAPLARRHRLALICPSFGLGNWQRPGGTEAVRQAVLDACQRFAIDPENLTLMVLSNGGRGATRLVARHPGMFRRVVLISPVLERQPLREGQRAWRDLPVLWIHGAEDRRIPLRATRDRIRLIEQAGARLTRRVFTGQDHFLFFDRRDEILPLIAQWISRN